MLASVNIFGGFLVTQRMLAMYKRRSDDVDREQLPAPGSASTRARYGCDDRLVGSVRAGGDEDSDEFVDIVAHLFQSSRATCGAIG